jgi:hypothetical protein
MEEKELHEEVNKASSLLKEVKEEISKKIV